MQLQQLEYFLTAARHEHVTNAARECSISQPALSNAIARLEHELGTPLFDRSGRNIKLNQFGEAFRSRIEKGFCEIEQAYQEVREMSGVETGVISFGMDEGACLAELMCGFYVQTPDARIRETVGNPADLIQRLEHDQIDFMICERISAAEQLDWTPLLSDRLFLMTAADHKLAGRESVALSELTDERFLLPRPGVGLRDSVSMLAAVAGLALDPIFEGDDLVALERMTAMGVGVSVTSGLTHRYTARTDARVALIPLTDRGCVRELGVYSKKDHFISRAAMRFIEYAKAFYAQTIPL